MIKYCKYCDKEKDVEAFNLDPGVIGGRRHQCKRCQSDYYFANREIKSQKMKEWYSKNRDQVLSKNRQYHEENRERDRAQSALYSKIHQERLNVVRRYRRKKDINYRLADKLRNRLSCAIKNNYKAGSAVRDLGCTVDFLKTHLQSKWLPGMTWDNHSFYGWHIDHIIPLAKFNLSNPEEFKKACHYTNLQPLWAKDNLRKSDKMIDNQPVNNDII